MFQSSLSAYTVLVVQTCLTPHTELPQWDHSDMYNTCDALSNRRHKSGFIIVFPGEVSVACGLLLMKEVCRLGRASVMTEMFM